MNEDSVDEGFVELDSVNEDCVDEGFVELESVNEDSVDENFIKIGRDNQYKWFSAAVVDGSVADSLR